MKPLQYKEYAYFFDIFSNEKLFPILDEFIGLNEKYLENCKSIVDVGGGTGYFTKKISTRLKNGKITLVEPSKDMLTIAKERLGNEVRYINSDIINALKNIDVCDSFIFMRSMYAMYGSLKSYKILVNDIYNKLSDNGIVAIFEMSKIYDVEFMKKYYYTNIDILGYSESEFEKEWPKMANVLEQFNRGVENGNFTLFKQSDVLELFLSVKFELLYNEGMIFFFKKVK